jgi:hypothetical protein
LYLYRRQGLRLLIGDYPPDALRTWLPASGLRSKAPPQGAPAE